jgi:glyoxylase-like metal-dependent hydrolase (beta-lactamase superfamily II)
MHPELLPRRRSGLGRPPKATRRATLGALGAGVATLLAPRSLRSAAVAGQQPPFASPEPEAAASRRFRIGTVEGLVVSDGVGPVPASFLAFNAPPAELATTVTEAGRSPERLDVPINILVLESRGEIMVVDTGFGPLGGDAAGRMLPGLWKAGIAPEDVAAVLLTHAHPDHVAGTMDAAGSPAFPNARYLIGADEWAWWTSEPSYAEVPFTEEFREFWRETARTYLFPLEDRIDLLAGDEEILPGIRVRQAPGHTPGMLAVEVASEGERLLHVADAAADPLLSLQHPDWFIQSDAWPAQALLTRRQLFSEAAADGKLVTTAHFATPGLGRVEEDGDRWTWRPAE